MKKYLANKYIYIPIFIILGLFTCLFCSYNFMDNDGYFILASGRYILGNGIPKINPFTMIENLKIVIQQWAWTVYCYFIYSKLGNIGIYISCIILYLLNIFMFFKLARLKEANINISLFFILFVFGMNSAFITIRPTLVTTFLIIWEIYILERYKIKNDKKILWLLVLISFLEINLHAAVWFLHFVFMLPYIVPPIKNKFIKFKEWNHHLFPIISKIIPMILVGFINPYGVDGILYIFNSYGSELNSIGISELNPYSLSSLFGIIIILTVFLILITLLKKKPVMVESFYLFCGTTILGFMHIRNRIYFFMGVICIGIELLSKINFEKIGKWIQKQNKYTTIFLWIVMTCLFLFIMPMIKDCVLADDTDTAQTPVKAIEYLDKNEDKNVKIYTEFNNGGYFEWNNYRSFIDARPELYFKNVNKYEDIFEEYSEIRCATDVKTFEEFLKKYRFDYLCITVGEKLDLYMQTKDDYEIVVNTDEYKLYKSK